MASRGVPHHVTLLFPFVPVDDVDAEFLDRLATIVRRGVGFDHSFVEARWFGHEVLWLFSDADVRFRELIDLVATEFPQYPPYGGEHADVVPHLTIADHGPLDAMRSAETTVNAHLPIRATTMHVSLLAEQHSGDWRRAERFALTASSRP